MPRSWVSVVVGILATVCFGLLARQCNRSQDPETAESRVAAERFAARDAQPGRAPDGSRRSLSESRRAAEFEDGQDRNDPSPGSIRDALARARQRAVTAPEPAEAPAGITPVARAQPGGSQAGAGQGVDPSAATDEDEDNPDAPALSLNLENSTVPEKGDTGPVVEQGISFDQGGAYFGEDAVLAMPSTDNVEGTAGTISFWIRPDWAGETDTNAALFQWRTNTFENRIQIFKNGPYLRFLFCDNTGIESGVGYNIIHWKADEWHAITATWGDSVTALYIDGASVGARDYSGELLIPPGTPWYFGSDHAGGAPGARSRIAGFQIFQRAMLPDEVMMLVTRTRPAQ